MIDILHSYPTWVVIISTYIIVDLLYLFIFSGYLKKTNGTIANKKIFWTKCVITNICSAFLLPVLMSSVYIFGYIDILNDKLMNLWYINIEYPIESYYIYFKAVKKLNKKISFKQKKQTLSQKVGNRISF